VDERELSADTTDGSPGDDRQQRDGQLKNESHLQTVVNRAITGGLFHRNAEGQICPVKSTSKEDLSD